jgi:predicted RNA binding protein YcfA (HicA-like mRNA interferase family)
VGYDLEVTWAEVIRKLKAAGFAEVRSGKGSHRLLFDMTGNTGRRSPFGPQVVFARPW